MTDRLNLVTTIYVSVACFTSLADGDSEDTGPLIVQFKD